MMQFFDLITSSSSLAASRLIGAAATAASPCTPAATSSVWPPPPPGSSTLTHNSPLHHPQSVELEKTAGLLHSSWRAEEHQDQNRLWSVQFRFQKSSSSSIDPDPVEVIYTHRPASSWGPPSWYRVLGWDLVTVEAPELVSRWTNQFEMVVLHPLKIPVEHQFLRSSDQFTLSRVIGRLRSGFAEQVTLMKRPLSVCVCVCTQQLTTGNFLSCNPTSDHWEADSSYDFWRRGWWECEFCRS